MADAGSRIGLLGTGWIGRARAAAIVREGAAQVVAIAEPDDAAASQTLALVPGALRVNGLEGLLGVGLDGVVIATPSALHAAQAERALAAGCAVFCQKPLGRTHAEVASVVAAARAANRALAVDLSYRGSEAALRLRDRMQAGELGRVHAVELAFHNAWGPDKPWFRDRALSGGGCLIDLGVHLVDLTLWMLGFPAVTRTDAALFAGGHRLPGSADAVEDHALAALDLADGAAVRLACSWNLPAGVPAEIGLRLCGTSACGVWRNVGGSFFDFEAAITSGHDRCEVLARPPDDWGGRASVAWARGLGRGARFDPAAAVELLAVAEVLDRLYGRPPTT